MHDSPGNIEQLTKGIELLNEIALTPGDSTQPTKLGDALANIVKTYDAKAPVHQRDSIRSVSGLLANANELASAIESMAGETGETQVKEALATSKAQIVGSLKAVIGSSLYNGQLPAVGDTRESAEPLDRFSHIASAISWNKNHYYPDNGCEPQALESLIKKGITVEQLDTLLRRLRDTPMRMPLVQIIDGVAQMQSAAGSNGPRGIAPSGATPGSKARVVENSAKGLADALAFVESHQDFTSMAIREMTKAASAEEAGKNLRIMSGTLGAVAQQIAPRVPQSTVT
jgi:hypothetical protein